MTAGIGHERHKASVFNGLSDLALVLGTEASTLGGDNFKLPRRKFAEDFYILIVNGSYFVLAGDTGHSASLNSKFKTQN